MDNNYDETNFILAQFFLDDPDSESPKIHSKKRQKRKGALLKELEVLIQSYEDLEIDIDLIPYKEALTLVRKLKVGEEYDLFIENLLSPYSS